MWIEKLSGGVLRLLTPLGPRYIRPSFCQRVYLLWIFRNFQTLPFQVLSARQRGLIEELCARERFISPLQFNPFEDAPVLGTLENRPPVETGATALNHSSADAKGAVPPFATDLHHRS
jgi:hypothetical protein